MTAPRRAGPAATACREEASRRDPARTLLGLPAAHHLQRKGEAAATPPCRRPGLHPAGLPRHLLASSAPTGVLGARGRGVSRGAHASQPPPLRVPWGPHPLRGKARRWVWLCRCGGRGTPRCGGQGRSWARCLVDGFACPEWETCPGAWKTGDAGAPNFPTAGGRVLTTRRSAWPVGAVMGAVLCGHRAGSWGPGARVRSPTHTGTCLHTETCLPSHTQLSHSHTCAAHVSILTLMLVHAHVLTPVHIHVLAQRALSTHTHTHTQLRALFSVGGEGAEAPLLEKAPPVCECSSQASFVLQNERVGGVRRAGPTCRTRCAGQRPASGGTVGVRADGCFQCF